MYGLFLVLYCDLELVSFSNKRNCWKILAIQIENQGVFSLLDEKKSRSRRKNTKSAAS
jgi:hypothetical protein